MKIRLAAPTSPVPVPAYLVGQPGISTETRSALAAISQIHGRVEVVHDQSNVFQGGRNRGWTLDQAAVLNALSGDHLHRATMAVTRADHQRPQQEAFFKFAERIGYRVLRHAPLHDERGRICEDEMKVDGACRELIHACVAGLPGVSDNLRTAIFSGASLPSALEAIGIKKSVLRRARKSRGGVFAAATPTDVDRVRRAWAWVERMQFLSRLPENLLYSPDFPEILDGVESFGVDEENDIDLAVLIYCAKPGRGFASFQRLAEVAINLEARSNSVPGRALSTNEAFSLALCRDTAVLRRLLGKLEMTALLDRILAQTPLELCQSDATLPCLAPLASTESAIDHGLESETCIKNCEAIFDYVLSGKILYSVRNAAGAVGTAAFQLQDGCKVVLVEVSGRANTEAPIDVLAAAKRAEDAALNAPAALRKFQLYLKNRDRLLWLATKRCADRLVALKH